MTKKLEVKYSIQGCQHYMVNIYHRRRKKKEEADEEEEEKDGGISVIKK